MNFSYEVTEALNYFNLDLAEFTNSKHITYHHIKGIDFDSVLQVRLTATLNTDIVTAPIYSGLLLTLLEIVQG